MCDAMLIILPQLARGLKSTAIFTLDLTGHRAAEAVSLDVKRQLAFNSGNLEKPNLFSFCSIFVPPHLTKCIGGHIFYYLSSSPVGLMVSGCHEGLKFLPTVVNRVKPVPSRFFTWISLS
jgi:hypothetical protein